MPNKSTILDAAKPQQCGGNVDLKGTAGCLDPLDSEWMRENRSPCWTHAEHSGHHAGHPIRLKTEDLKLLEESMYLRNLEGTDSKQRRNESRSKIRSY